MFTTIREENPQAVKMAMEQIGTVWLTEMERIVSADLAADLQRDPGLLGLRNASFKVRSLLHSLPERGIVTDIRRSSPYSTRISPSSSCPTAHISFKRQCGILPHSLRLMHGIASRLMRYCPTHTMKRSSLAI